MNLLSTRVIVPLLILFGLAYLANSISGLEGGRSLAFSLLTGAAFGIVLQRSRFCFLCNFRDLVEQRDPKGVIAILVALAAGVVFYHIVMMAWVPVPILGRLPPNAHIGPVGPVLGLAAFVFGLGMAMSGSCLSAHIYRLGEGSPVSPFALGGAAIGFLIGFMTWNPLYLASVANSPSVWLPHSIGYPATIALSLGVCAFLAVIALKLASARHTAQSDFIDLASAMKAVFVERWPPITVGILVALISAFAFLRIAPLGVTAELGSIVRTAGTAAAVIPDTLLGLDTLRGCATIIKNTVFSPNGLFVLGMVLASFAAAFGAGQFQPKRPTLRDVIRGSMGGILMGWGAMTGLGCTVGVLLSGVHAGALSGWVFLVFCSFGAWVGLFAMRRFSIAR
ncbi:YeeE/YedE family protein [Phyllobacterium sp. YR531]|uniref:YeeE/YedE family protein n=1 Tax=Phyllobacterium sp. YR531 TaxID=1144343 RepID=UPI00026FC3AE|nr:YeeE/YedE family protein [Phyllobacterium sp. YR531]EJN03024.1 YeeE/YedE family protein (DUF395) [Phyllobacterium sp. YR531]